ncbi:MULTISPECIES: hypothetical protein [Stappiaceae]|jgi:hypothetical protein|nr:MULTISPECIES: hypothetical protein [Stappiaceae]ERP88464.1 hypothetical protein Q669_08390 [Labrenzia sp. C1B10]ERP99591.1 hypothetical protein Q675_13530 [Labrenzia sp. C1B70]MCR9285358.1 hypothetical protein [Paracoccaceae bacterium]MEC9404273.1 hypothetical protein [Pseudomonadota bacterium]EAV44603.1 hypothetical protein SIAM614_06983 [Roseibium aggregatum IAM 12614]
MRMPLFMGLTAGATGLVALSAFLWLYAGERVYADRLISAIAGCF